MDRYLDKVAVSGPDDCWIWTATTSKSGHGLFWDGTMRASGGPRMVGAHRWGYEHHRGPIPDGLCVCHSCDTPRCQNPAHWFLGTVGDNNRDRQAKGRSVMPNNAGERHGMSRLSPEDITTIRQRVLNGETQIAVAKDFGVRQQHISKIINNKTWSHHQSSSSSS